MHHKPLSKVWGGCQMLPTDMPPTANHWLRLQLLDMYVVYMTPLSYNSMCQGWHAVWQAMNCFGLCARTKLLPQSSCLPTRSQLFSVRCGQATRKCLFKSNLSPATSVCRIHLSTLTADGNSQPEHCHDAAVVQSLMTWIVMSTPILQLPQQQ